MLVAIQKKLSQTECPSCKKKDVLQANLSCSRDDKKCSTTCQCNNCGLSLIVRVPEGENELSISKSELVMECDLVTSQCELTSAKPLSKAG